MLFLFLLYANYVYFYNHISYFKIIVFPQSLLLACFFFLSVNGTVLSDAIKTQSLINNV